MTRRLRPLLIAPILTCGLLAACGPDAPLPADLCGPDTARATPGRATICGSVLLPQVGAVSSQSVKSDGSPVVSDWSRPHVPGEVLIVGAGAPVRLPGTLGTLSVQSTGLAGVQQVNTPAGQSDEDFAVRLVQELTAQGLKTQGLNGKGLNSTGAVIVQPNYLYSALANPNDPGYPSNPAGVQVNGQTYRQDYLQRINASGGWDVNTGGAVTAVIDTGIDLGHPEFRGRLLPGYDFAFDDADPTEATGGDVGHGTSSAGLIGALGNNKVGIAGLTWSGQNILPVKVFDNDGGASTINLGKAIDFSVKKGAKVVNMSLGVAEVNVKTGQYEANTDTVLAGSISAATAAGLVLVAAAGNLPDVGLYYPAADPNVLAVGALGSTDDLASYSARPKGNNKPLDLVAPGGSGNSGATTILSLNPTNLGSYAVRAGTSEAAPLVSGAASLLRSLRPDLNVVQVKAVLTSTARTVSGGKLLDVGAALNLAACLPRGSDRPYTLNIDNGTTSKTYTGTIPANATTVPYTATGLPNGSRAITAILKVGGGTCTGRTTLTVNGNATGQNIQVR